MSLPSAVQVLEMREGLQRTRHLGGGFVARSGGPGKIDGLAFLDGKFLFHAWVEYHDGAVGFRRTRLGGKKKPTWGMCGFCGAASRPNWHCYQVVGNLKNDTLTWEQQP